MSDEQQQDNVPPSPPSPAVESFIDKVDRILGKVGMELKDDATIFWKKVSVWMFAIVAAAPDLYDAAIQQGLIHSDHIPAGFSEVMKVIAFIGVASKLVQTKAKDQS